MIEITVTSPSKDPVFMGVLEDRMKSAIEEASATAPEVKIKTKLVFNPNK